MALLLRKNGKRTNTESNILKRKSNMLVISRIVNVLCTCRRFELRS